MSTVWSTPSRRYSLPSSSPLSSSPFPLSPSLPRIHITNAHIHSSPHFLSDIHSHDSDEREEVFSFWDHHNPSSYLQKHPDRTETLPSFRSLFSAFAKDDQPERVLSANDIDSYHDMALASLEESNGESEEEEMVAEGYRFQTFDSRATYFNTSEERGRWLSDPIPPIPSPRMTRRQRQSEPVSSPLLHSMPSIIMRPISEPAPSRDDRSPLHAVSDLPSDSSSGGQSSNDSMKCHPVLTIDTDFDIPYDSPFTSPLPPSSPPLSPLHLSLSPLSPISLLSSPSSAPSLPTLSESPLFDPIITDDTDIEELDLSINHKDTASSVQPNSSTLSSPQVASTSSSSAPLPNVVSVQLPQVGSSEQNFLLTDSLSPSETLSRESCPLPETKLETKHRTKSKSRPECRAEKRKNESEDDVARKRSRMNDVQNAPSSEKPKKKLKARGLKSGTITPPEVLSSFEAEVRGMLVESMATSRASSMTVSALFRAIMQSRPSLKKERTEQEWIEVFETALKKGEASCGVFGVVESSYKDDSRHLMSQWFYVPERDNDQERAALLRLMMPQGGKKRNETKKYKQYYYEPIAKISKWDPEDDS